MVGPPTHYAHNSLRNIVQKDVTYWRLGRGRGTN